MKKEHLVNFLLRAGLAFVFLYAGISIIANSNSWIGFIPSFFDKFVSRYAILYIHAGFDILLGAWLLSGKKIFYAAVLCSLNLLGVILFNLGSLDILFRDIALIFASLALVVLNYEKNKKNIRSKE